VLSAGLSSSSSSSSTSVARPRAPRSLTPHVRILLSLVRPTACMPPQVTWTTPTSFDESRLLRRGRVTSVGPRPLIVLLPRPSSAPAPSPKTNMSNGAVGTLLIFSRIFGVRVLGAVPLLVAEEGFARLAGAGSVSTSSGAGTPFLSSGTVGVARFRLLLLFTGADAWSSSPGLCVFLFSSCVGVFVPLT